MDDEGKSGPGFLVYFGPVLDALRELGGENTPDKVCQWIRERLQIPAEELATTKGGRQTKFENKVGWARFYLVKAGLLDGSKHGIWGLTAEGERTKLDAESALPIFKTIREKFRAAEDEDQPAPSQVIGSELFADPSRRFWFVGASWSDGDQTDRFIVEGLWQNDYKDKFLSHVKAMKPGDKIAIKSTFTRKYDLPFDNKDKTVSVMRLKAIGTVTGNHGDGRTVEVEWERLDPPRDWYFYTYRVTVVEADASDDLARRLLLFAFGDAKQDYGFWTSKVPYFAKRFAEDEHADDILTTDAGEEDEAQNLDPDYTLDSILEEGCFVPRAELERCLNRLRTKQNLILQGPPGTGKTWLAKRLGYVLLGSKDRRTAKHRMRVVQFHPSLTYEDFIRGWRPTSGGQLKLVDGIFLETVQAATAEPDRPFVLIIEEINRGNPAQIFGEMLTLLENTKRRPEEAMELAYRREQGEQVFVPKNLHVIGTMNLADRSLAIVDMALRRRFSFVTLEPQFNETWRAWCQKSGGLLPDFVTDIAARLASVNQQIAEDRALGEQYCIGHSYFTPAEVSEALDGPRWFTEIVEAEIVPLLQEYWFDDDSKVRSARHALLDGLA